MGNSNAAPQLKGGSLLDSIQFESGGVINSNLAPAGNSNAAVALALVLATDASIERFILNSKLPGNWESVCRRHPMLIRSRGKGWGHAHRNHN